MSYYANGSGHAQLKPNVNRQEITERLRELNSGIDYDIDDTGISWWKGGNYNESNTEEFLNTIIPYINNGDAKYTGEEGEMWRFILVNGEWVEQSARIYYTVEDMIKALEKEGYTVTKG